MTRLALLFFAALASGCFAQVESGPEPARVCGWSEVGTCTAPGTRYVLTGARIYFEHAETPDENTCYSEEGLCVLDDEPSAIGAEHCMRTNTVCQPTYR